MINGVPVGSPADEVRSLYFSPGGAHLMHQARSGKQWTLMVDGRPTSMPYDEVRGPVFKPRHHPAGLRRQTGRTSRRRRARTPSRTPICTSRVSRPMDGGSRSARSPDKKWILILDGAPAKQFDDIVAVSFSQGGGSRMSGAAVMTTWSWMVRKDRRSKSSADCNSTKPSNT